MALKGNIFEAKTLDELQTMGKLADVRGPLKEMAAKYNIKVVTNKWILAWEGIQAVKKAIEDDDPFFKSKAARLIFFLTQADGEMRMKELGVNRKHFADKDYAKAWMTDLLKVVHPDNCKHPLAADATAEVNRIYRDMVK